MVTRTSAPSGRTHRPPRCVFTALVPEFLQALFGDGLFLFCRGHGGCGVWLSSLADQGAGPTSRDAALENNWTLPF